MNNNELKTESIQSSHKVTTLADLLSPEELEELSKLGSNPPKKRSSLSLTLKDCECVLPLDPRHKDGGYRVLKVRPKVKKNKTARDALLWHAIYGNKSLRVIDWNILFNIFNRSIVNDKPAVALLAILRITAAGKPADCKSIKSSLYSVRQIASNVLGKELSLKFCQRLQKFLGVELPTSVENLDDVFDLSTKVRRNKKPKEPNRIGVGYKDKGTLSQTPKEEPLDGDFEPVEDCFAQLIEATDNCRAFDSAFDKKRRKKLLSKIIDSLKD